MSTCHAVEDAVSPPSEALDQAALNKRLILCGHPNVGKSLVFNFLTRRYVTVSNYPGTTVEISSGTCSALPDIKIHDTPGAYSLLPISEEEKVTREILLTPQDDIVVHIVDAKSLRRMLPLTLELKELGRQVILLLNLMDEARHYNVSIDSLKLGKLLQVPVIEAVATRGEGLPDIAHVIRDGIHAQEPIAIHYDQLVEHFIQQAIRDGHINPQEATPTQAMASPAADSLTPEEAGDLELSIRKTRQAYADKILVQCASFPRTSSSLIASMFDRITFNMWTAIPLALAILYFGVYQFVGVFGAGTVVDFIENGVYETYITPTLTGWVEAIIPWPILQDLFVHDYGILTLGLRYAIALILPIVGSFFLLFSVLEDSGYLPRLALLLDKLFKKIGLNGRAVIPIILGLGCGTMATMVTRVLETRRERIISTLLLGVAVPCSAQLGVILGILSGRPAALLAWGSTMAALFIVLGLVAAKAVPGEAPSFYLELPPLRIPRLRNVLTKTYSRMHWYFVEILPLFILASALIWIGNITHLFNVVVGIMKPLVRVMGLPDSAAPAFLFGFFRRDYGAAGLFDLQRDGLLDARQSFVSVLVISLLLPCIAQFFVVKKERGWKFALSMAGGIMVFACVFGIAANWFILATGIM